jgi:hypothetical protein
MARAIEADRAMSLETAITAVATLGPITEPLSDAFEHLRYCAEGRGQRPWQVLGSIGVQAGLSATWLEAIWKLAEIWHRLKHPEEAKGEEARGPPHAAR